MEMQKVTLDLIRENRTRFAQNLQAWYELSLDLDMFGYGSIWYPKAVTLMKWAGETYGVDPAIAAYTCAALSPGVNWIKNIVDTENMLIDPMTAVVSTYNRNRDKARAIVTYGDLDQLSGRKVVAFAYNLIGLFDRLTIDRHISRIIIQHPRDLPLEASHYAKYISSAKKHSLMEGIMQTAADELCMLPAPLQSLLWVTFRRHHNMDTHDVRQMENAMHRPIVAKWNELIGHWMRK